MLTVKASDVINETLDRDLEEIFHEHHESDRTATGSEAGTKKNSSRFSRH